MRTLAYFLLLSFCLVIFGAPSALAIPPFQKVFVKQYTDKEKEPNFAAKVKEAKCFVCHDPKFPKKKKKRNRYGKELSKLLDKKKDKKNTAKVIEAMKTVAALHIDPKDDSSPTYGELIQEGKLPGGMFVKPVKK